MFCLVWSQSETSYTFLFVTSLLVISDLKRLTENKGSP
jgi:hypothetical protein